MDGALQPYNPDPDWSNPAEYGWPALLAIEVAMQRASIKDICEAYNIERERWNDIRQNPAFVSELTGAMEALRQEGASFKIRAQMQAGELLKDIWKIIHDKDSSLAIRADMIKFVIRIAGFDASKDQGGVFGKGGAGAGGFALNIVMGDLIGGNNG